MAKKYYAVKHGKTPGIYESWDECKKQVYGFSGAVYKSFGNRQEALDFINSTGIVNKTTKKSEIISKDDFAVSDSETNSNIIERTTTEYAVAYVDGSYNNATSEFSYGVVMFHNKKELHFSEKVEDEDLSLMRNVAGEIKGAEAAMQYAHDNGCKKLTIYHDYEGIARWCLGDWKANKPGTIAYKNFYDELKNDLDVEFIKVKGHSNDKYNDLADELAKKAIF